MREHLTALGFYARLDEEEEMENEKDRDFFAFRDYLRKRNKTYWLQAIEFVRYPEERGLRRARRSEGHEEGQGPRDRARVERDNRARLEEASQVVILGV